MSANGIFPKQGVDAAQALNTYTPQITPTNTACKINWYPSRRCAVQVDTDALNGIMASLLCVIDTAQLPYDCSDPCLLAKATRRLSVVCRSNITPAPAAWPPTAYVGDLITDDTSGTANIAYWDCNSNAYVTLVDTTTVPEVVCRSTLAAGAFPPATNVGQIIIDDTDDSALVVYFWDCNSAAYRVSRQACNYFWADSVFDAAGLGGGATLADGASITVPMNITLHCLPHTVGIQIAYEGSAQSVNFDYKIRLRGSGTLVCQGSVSGVGNGNGTWKPMTNGWTVAYAHAASGGALTSPPDFPVRSTTLDATQWFSKDTPIDVELVSRGSTGSGKILGVALFDYLANNFIIYTTSGSSGGTCFPAGSMVRMADGTSKPIEDVRAGDLVWSPKLGADIVSDAHATTLGTRKLFRMDDDSLRWSEEHSFWVRRGTDQRLWSMNVDLLIEEARRGEIIGLSDWDWPYEGAANAAEDFGRDDGTFVAKTPTRVRGADKAEPLYFVETKGGGLISVNGYVVGAGLDHTVFDYKAFRLDKKSARAA